MSVYVHAEISDFNSVSLLSLFNLCASSRYAAFPADRKACCSLTESDSSVFIVSQYLRPDKWGRFC